MDYYRLIKAAKESGYSTIHICTNPDDTSLEIIQLQNTNNGEWIRIEEQKSRKIGVGQSGHKSLCVWNGDVIGIENDNKIIERIKGKK